MLCVNCYGRQWRADHPERTSERQRKYNGQRKPENTFAATLRYRYNITPARYFEMLDRQGGVCAICDSPPPEGKRLYVDHDHACCPGERSCGECVRGLLCFGCNTLLGMAADRADVLEAALAYLKGV